MEKLHGEGLLNVLLDLDEDGKKIKNGKKGATTKGQR